MKEKALELLKIFSENGYEAYLVGGFVRDYVLGKKSFDIDICTNALPKDIIRIFRLDKDTKEVIASEKMFDACNVKYKCLKK